MSDYRFNDNDFLTLNRKIKKYIKFYGEDHHLSQRWIKRSTEIEKRTK